MSARYKIDLKDTDGLLVAEFDNFTSLQVSHRINSIDTCNFGISDEDPRISLFELDGQIEVYRSYPEFGVDWYLEFEGFFRTFTRQTYEDGNRYYTAFGRGYNDLLNRRIVAYYAGTDFASKSGPGETVMKEYVDQNCGPSASGMPSDWLGTWAKRIEITVDNTNIDSDQTHYPIPVFINSSSGQGNDDLTVIFDEVGAEDQKIAVTKDDGLTQIYVEVEDWDAGAEEAVIWVSKSDLDITAASTTTLYIYYDSTQADNATYVDVAGSRTEVWDSDFLRVIHGVDATTSTVVDSTGTGNGTKGAANQPTEIDGDLGKSQDFDSANSEEIDFASEPISDTTYTVTAYLSFDDVTEVVIFSQRNTANNSSINPQLYTDGSGYPSFIIRDDGADSALAQHAVALSTATYYSLHGTRDGTTVELFKNGSSVATDTDPAVGAITINNNFIGCYQSTGAKDLFFDGQLDEFRISDIVRSDDWIKIDHYAFTDDLLSFGAEETLTSNRFSDGTMTGFTIEADSALGSTWEGSKAYINILSVCQDIANKSGVDFKVRGNGAAQFIFRTYLGQLGDDRSVVGLDSSTGLNAAGNAPVIFTLARGNMGDPAYSSKRMQEKNFCYVLGQGIEDDRDVTERSDTDAIDDSPWNKVEFTRDARNRSTTTGYESAGDSALEENQAEETFSFTPIQVESTLYGRDYFFGDIITARYGDIEKNKKLIGLDILVNNRGDDDPETINLTLGDVLP